MIEKIIKHTYHIFDSGGGASLRISSDRIHLNCKSVLCFHEYSFFNIKIYILVGNLRLLFYILYKFI